MRLDREFFVTHPEAQGYAPRVVPGEWPTRDRAALPFVLVVEVRPGERFRIGFDSADGKPPPDVIAQALAILAARG